MLECVGRIGVDIVGALRSAVSCVRKRWRRVSANRTWED